MIHPHPARAHVPVRIALTGANGGYGRTLLAQLRRTPELVPAVLVDPDAAGLDRTLAELGLDRDRLTVLPDAAGVAWADVDVLVEATGRIDVGTACAAAALDHGVHVVMVSKEVDTVAGIALAERARAAGRAYLPADGDQPANLIRLVDWVSATGLEIVAIGKAGEYDLVLDPVAGTVEQNGSVFPAPALAGLLDLGPDVRATLAARADAVAALKRSAAADLCEMTVVATRTGAVPDREDLHYPVARIAELADVYAAREHGGVRSRDGVVDVFSALRLPGEASVAGGVFAVVRTDDPVTWEMLRGKGHVVSRDGRYACLYWPYHAMGAETPLTIHAAVDGAGPAPQPRPTTVLAARTAGDLDPGTEFTVAGHHHEIAGVAPVMVAAEPGVAPYYLLAGARLNRAVGAGELVRVGDLDGADPGALAAHRVAEAAMTGAGVPA
ncbi:homoserine dehydrogenase [Pseudonocardia sp. HH130630-07]|uniref:homoserine dehydrogenase n=1 Tax=Pseudonocardia sp. HH130630-07 TaxID=1690815 RepID=UPI0008152CA3|nr:homoserine dehydrogenase [Pseudonocardia sp. HH130630-07]ANY09332.1 homoserine dehydrogenase [Pseudonocardia sp. HH130630-07]